jgi:glycosyltransferase involved in cell wall biosynthesis
MLAIIDTHPIQYHAPVYRSLQQGLHVPVTVLYGSDFSVQGYHDKEFRADFSWDVNLLSGYDSEFLLQTSIGGARNMNEILTTGLTEALDRIQPRAVLLTGYGSRFHLSAFWKVWHGKYPILFRAETTDHAKHRNPVQQWVRDQTLKRFYACCSKLLYIGMRSHKHFQRLECPEEKLIFSPYCIDDGNFSTDEKSRDRLRVPTRMSLGLHEDQIGILFSGKLSFRKGPDLISKAIQLLHADLRNKIVLIFLGDGTMREELNAMIAAEPRSKAVFTGFQNQSKLSAFYHAADLLVLPSRHSETWGLVVNEALHHGLPCVVSEAVGCVTDLIEPGRTGEIFETGKADRLASALVRALSLVDRADIREACRKQMENYTVEKAAEGIAAAYFSLGNKV